jgi:TATA-binding protein-associated factor Taf7
MSASQRRDTHCQAEPIEACFNTPSLQAQSGQCLLSSFQHRSGCPLKGPSLLKNQDYAEHQNRHGVGRDLDLEAETGDQPGSGRGTDIGAEDDPDARRKPDQAGAEERNSNHRKQRTGPHDDRGDDAKRNGLPQVVCSPLKQALQKAEGEGAEALPWIGTSDELDPPVGP